MQTLFQTVMTEHAQEKLEMGRKHLDHYRRQGTGMPPTPETGEDMRITSAGPVTIHQLAPQQSQSATGGKSWLVPILCAALGTLGPAGAVGGYLLSRWAAQVPSQQTAAPVAEPIRETITETIRESISIDLGKIPAP